MAARVQQGGRPGGTRFAQFKLVLLGKLMIDAPRVLTRFWLTYTIGESAVGKVQRRCLHTQQVPTNTTSEFASTTIRQRPVRRLSRIHYRRSFPHSNHRAGRIDHSQVRDMGYCGSRTLQVTRTYVLPQCQLRGCRLRYYTSCRAISVFRIL